MQENFKNIEFQDIQFFNEILDSSRVIVDEETRKIYGSDETEDLCFPPAVVLKPTSTAEVSALLRYCNENRICVTPIGAKTGLSGGALSIYGGVGLSLEKMNRILEIDEKTTEPGVITQVLQEACAAKGWYYAPDPSSKGSCFIGGNIAENAGGAHAVKYGVTKDFVLNLEVVLANGDVIWTGANTLKNSTGYNLTQLMVGSEGTLGVVTQAVLKLIPLPRHQMLMLVPFYQAEQACQAVSAIFQAGLMPSALEFMERDAIDFVLQFLEDVVVPVEDKVQAHLLIEVDGNYPEALMQDCEKMMDVLAQFDCGDPLFAEDETQKNQLWKMRRKVAEAVKSHSVYKEEDTVVPRYQLPALLKAVKDTGAKYGFRSICYGHAGDGNLHVNIIKDELTDEQWHGMLPQAITEIFQKTVALGGTLSGEHGIGYVQRPYMSLAFSNVELALMKSIKNVFDANGILNPGKVL
ncbi:MAG: FAD-binding protein [Bacteroidetes bacterium]|nr:FAD-binding protein [Bacteroidota bacterium]